MSCTGTPSVMQQTVLMSKSRDSKIASAQNAAGTNITLAFAPVSYGLFHGVEDRYALVLLAALARGHPGHHVGAALDYAPGVEAALAAGYPLYDEARLVVDQYRHRLPAPVLRELHGPARRVEHSLLGVYVLRCVLGEYLASLLGVRPVQAHDDGQVYLGLFERREEAPGDLVAAGDPAEDVEEDALDLLVRGDDVECLGDLVRVRPAADVQEVRWLPAGLRHDVERAHHEPRPVTEDTHVPVELDILQARLLRPLLPGVGRFDVVHLADVPVAKEARV